MTGYLQLGPVEVALSALLLLINVVLSWVLRLELGARLLIVAVRMTVQLVIIGYVLDWIFALDRPLEIVALAVAMAAMASIAAVGRTSRRFAGVYWDSLVSVMGASFLVTGISLVGILQIRPWYESRYLVPLLGMVLGNAMTGISLSVDRFVDGLEDRKGGIEARLSLGATRWEAALDEIRGAIRTGMIPTLNTMAVMGVVSLPGMMTGQILAGAAPGDAVRYQIVIMFMIASATALGMLGMVLLTFRTVFDRAHRLRLDRLRAPAAPLDSLRRLLRRPR